ncbi:unnamed protein product [Hanseniaspora opuntiae]
MALLKELLAHAEKVLDFDIIFDAFQDSLLALNDVAVDFVDDSNIIIQDLLIYTDSHNEILSWNGGVNNDHNTSKFTIIVNNQILYDKIKNSKVLQLAACPTGSVTKIEKYTLMIYKKEDFDYINNNQVFFINCLPEYKRFLLMNQKEFIYLKKRMIECTLIGTGENIIKLTPDVELEIRYIGGNVKVYNKVLDVKPLDQLEDFQICINLLNVVDNQLQTIGTNGEEFELDFNTKASSNTVDVEKYEYLSIYEIHKLCLHYAAAGKKVVVIDVPFLINAIKDKKMSLSDLLNIYVFGKKTKLNEAGDEKVNIYDLMKKFLNEFKKLVPKCNKDITVLIKNADYLFINDVLKKEEKISISYYKWQAYFLELNNFVEDMIVSNDKSIQIILQSEDFEDDTKFPRFFDDLLFD